MRCLKLLAVLGLILAVSGTAGALTYIPFRESWDGPVVAHIYDLSQSTTYRPVHADGTAFSTSDYGKWWKPSDLVSSPGLATNPGEANWSIFQIDVIYKGTDAGYNNITEIDTSHPLYMHGDNNIEVVGALFGRQDNLVKFTSPARFEYESRNDYVEVFAQTLGTAAPNPAIGIGAAGSAGRIYDANSGTYLNEYVSIGYDAAGNLLGDAPVLVLSPDAGYFGDEFDTDPNHYDANYAPNIHQVAEAEGYFVLSASHGELDSYYSVIGGTSVQSWDTDFFSPMSLMFPKPWANSLTTSDIRIHVTNDPIGNRPNAAYDWPMYSSDPLRAYFVPIPEPLTVLGAFLGLGGLGGYIRRRRRD